MNNPNPVMHSSDGVSLREYVESRLKEADLRYEQKFDAHEKALAQALAAAQESARIQERSEERWKDSTNEWRGAMNDRERTLLSRAEYNVGHENLMGRVDALEKCADIASGKASQSSATFAIIVAILGVLLGILNLIGKL